MSNSDSTSDRFHFWMSTEDWAMEVLSVLTLQTVSCSNSPCHFPFEWDVGCSAADVTALYSQAHPLVLALTLSCCRLN